MDFAEERKQKRQDLEDAIGTVFSYWVAASGRGRRTLLSRERKLKIRQRITEQPPGTMEELVSPLLWAVDGCLSSSYHTENGYTDLELILRSRSKLEAFAERTNGYQMEKIHPILSNST